MHKLKLESLRVDSFETTPVAPRLRGTVQGRVDLTNGCSPGCTPACEQPPPTTQSKHSDNPQECYFETNLYFDCTYGCTALLCSADTCKVELCPAEHHPDDGQG